MTVSSSITPTLTRRDGEHPRGAQCRRADALTDDDDRNGKPTRRALAACVSRLLALAAAWQCRFMACGGSLWHAFGGWAFACNYGVFGRHAASAGR